MSQIAFFTRDGDIRATTLIRQRNMGVPLARPYPFVPSILSVQREHEQVARVLQVIELDRMQVAAAGLHGEVLLRSDRIGHRRTFERRADIEAPELLQGLVV